MNRDIDVDELIRKINEYECYSYDSEISRICELINDAPARDVEPVRHGHWINDIHYPNWTCSECGDHEGNKTDKYCHICGAKMDEKEQEHE